MSSLFLDQIFLGASLLVDDDSDLLFHRNVDRL